MPLAIKQVGYSKTNNLANIDLDAIVASIGATTPASYNALMRVFNVRDTTYGAKGDGVTDDTAAIQAAINAAIIAGGIVLFPPGYNYLVKGTPTLTASTNVTLWGYGATITLNTGSTNATGFTVAGATTYWRAYGFRFVGSAVVGDNHAGILTASSPTGNMWRIVDCRFENLVRGAVVDVLTTPGNIRDVKIIGCSASNIVGTASGQGYGLVLSGVYGGGVYDSYVEAAQRHGIYISVCQAVKAIGNTIYHHRFGVAPGGQFGGIEVARSAIIDVIGNTFDTCQDGALSIEPHDTNTLARTRGINVIGNSFVDSIGQDTWIGSGSPGTSSELSDVVFEGNTLIRSSSETAGTESVRVRAGKRIRIQGNSWYAANSYGVTKSMVYVAADGGATYTDYVDIRDNHAIVTGAAGDVHLVEVSSAVCGGSSNVRIFGNAPNLSGGTGTSQILFDATVTNPNIITAPQNVAQLRLTGQTGAVATVTQATVGTTDGTFQVSANVLVTTATNHAFTVTVAYHDEGNNARTLTLSFILVAGGTLVTSIANANGTVPYMGVPQTIRCKAGTTITIATTGTFTTVTYNVEGNIQQVA